MLTATSLKKQEIETILRLIIKAFVCIGHQDAPWRASQLLRLLVMLQYGYSNMLQEMTTFKHVVYKCETYDYQRTSRS